MDKKKGQINMRELVYIVAVILNLQLGCKDNPINSEKHENRSPIIILLTVFPEVVKPSDSLIVVCNATDPDCNTLVYDWYTTGIVRIKGLPSWDCCSIYNTFDNSQIFYAPDSLHISTPQDTFWVQCATRDGKGGQAVKLIHFIVKSD
jgi:hypothetical protein